MVGTLSIASLAALAACTPTTSASKVAKPVKDGDTLNLYSWTDYFDPAVLADFEKKHGISIKQTATSSVQEMLQRLVAKQPFDVAIANSTFLPQVTPTGLLQTIDTAKLHNYSQVLPEFRTPYFDSAGQYAVTYAMGGVGIAYRKSKYPNLTGSWADIWNNIDTDPTHLYLLDDYQVSLAMALMYLGLDPASASKSDLDKAADALISLKPKLGGMLPSATVQALSSGQATMTPSYLGDALSAYRKMGDDAGDLGLEMAGQGQLFNADTMVIPTAAAHPGNAMLFLDHVLQPDNMAKNVEYIGYPVPTTAGMQAYDTLVSDIPFLKIDTSILSKTQAWQQGLDEKQRPLWNSAWLKFQQA